MYNIKLLYNPLKIQSIEKKKEIYMSKLLIILKKLLDVNRFLKS